MPRIPKTLIASLLLIAAPIAVRAEVDPIWNALAGSGSPRIEVVRPVDSGVNGRIFEISSLKDGRLAVLAESGVHLYDGNRWSQLEVNGWPNSVTPLPENSLLLGTSGGAYELHKNAFGSYDIYPVNLGPSMHSVSSLERIKESTYALWADSLAITDEQGNVELVNLESWAGELFSISDELYLIGGTSSGISRWDLQSSSIVPVEKALAPVEMAWPKTITPRSKGGYWILTVDHQIAAFDGTSSWAWEGNELLGELSTEITVFLEHDTDSLAFGTADGEIFIYDADCRLSHRISSPFGSVTSLGLDAQGGLWASSKSYLSRISLDQEVLFYDERQGVAETVEAIEVYQDRLFVGTATGLHGARTSDDHTEEFLERIDDTPGVTDLFAYDGDLFIAGEKLQILRPDGQIHKLSEDGGTHFWQPSRLPNIVLAGSHTGIIAFEKIEGVWRRKSTYPSAEVFSMTESSDGTIWGSTGGKELIKLTPESLKEGRSELTRVPDQLNSSWIQVTEIDGEVYLNGEPCYRWDVKAKEWLPTPDLYYFVGEPPFGFEQVYGYHDDRAYVSINSRRGSTLKRPNARVRGVISTAGGLTDGRAKSIVIDPTGAAWIGGSFGLIRASSPYRKVAPLESKPYLTSLSSLVDGSSISVNAEHSSAFILAPNQRSLRFEVSFQEFNSRGPHSFQIFIDGLDSVWPARTPTDFREITNIPPGKYTLMVRAQIASGQVSEVLSLPFVVNAPWWMKKVAYAGYVLAGFLLLIGTYRFAGHQKNLRAKRLEKLVEERTAELELRKLKLQRQSDLLTEQNGELEEKSARLQETTQSLSTALAELRETQERLVDTARTAGKAEVAINVIHNVGNTLNSVNTGLYCILSTLEESKTGKLKLLAGLIEENLDDIGNYLLHDPKGAKIPHYIVHLSNAVEKEMAQLSDEARLIESEILHIKKVLSEQQSHAKRSIVCEEIQLCDLFESTTMIARTSPAAPSVEFINDIPRHLSITSDRSKLLDVLVNLTMNAVEAVPTDTFGIHCVRALATQNAETIQLSIMDNGVGFCPDQSTRLFQHGFTTKKQGHGFGLHSAANSAQELGGTLSLTSDGPSKGATAILSLPIAPPENEDLS